MLAGPSKQIGVRGGAGWAGVELNTKSMCYKTFYGRNQSLYCKLECQSLLPQANIFGQGSEATLKVESSEGLHLGRLLVQVDGLMAADGKFNCFMTGLCNLLSLILH